MSAAFQTSSASIHLRTAFHCAAIWACACASLSSAAAALSSAAVALLSAAAAFSSAAAKRSSIVAKPWASSLAAACALRSAIPAVWRPLTARATCGAACGPTAFRISHNTPHNPIRRRPLHSARYSLFQNRALVCNIAELILCRANLGVPDFFAAASTGAKQSAFSQGCPKGAVLGKRRCKAAEC